MARWPWWIRAVAGVAVAVVAIVVLGIVVARRRAVRVPVEEEAPPASAAVSGEAPKKHAEPTAEPSGSPAPPSSSVPPRESPGRTSGPVASGSSAATGTLPGANAATGAFPGANGAAPPAPATAPSASATPAATPVLPAATSGQPISPEAPSSGWISVWSTPWGRVRVDGRDVGDSPAIRIAAPPGPHSVSVKSEGGEQSRGVTVKAGEEAKVRFVF